MNSVFDFDEKSDVQIEFFEQDGKDALVPESQTALVCGQWELRRGKDAVDSWQEMGANVEGIDVLDAADAHEALFDPDPELAPNPNDKAKAKWFEQLLQTPEFAELHKHTMLETHLATIAAKRIVDQWLDYKKEAESNNDSGGDSQQDQEESIGQEVQRIASTAQAVQQAMEDVEEAENLGIGLGMGDPKDIDWKKTAKIFQSIRNDSRLRKILDMAGKMRMLARTLQQNKAVHGRDDMVGIELSGDLSRIIPSELMQLDCGIQELELIQLQKLANRQCLSRKYQGTEHVQRGPIVVCVDESGSMSYQDRIILAKAFALTMAWIAHQQKRWIALVGYSGEPESEKDLSVVAFAPGQVDQAKLLDWITHMYDGGTSLKGPLGWIPEKFWDRFVANGMPRGKTDMIVITDGEVYGDPDLEKQFQEWKKTENVTAYGMLIGTKNDVLERVCDKLWQVQNVSMEEDAVQELLAI